MRLMNIGILAPSTAWHLTHAQNIVRPSHLKKIFVSIRSVNPNSFVYGPEEDSETETCMAEKMNFTFHVRKDDCVDICNKPKECYRYIALEDIIYSWCPSAHGPPQLTKGEEQGAAWELKPFPLRLLLFSYLSFPVPQARISLQYMWKWASRNGGNAWNWQS